jgi:excisionase family DNA binding protein
MDGGERVLGDLSDERPGTRTVPFRWFSVAEVAEALNVTPACIRRWCRLGVIASLRIGKYRRIGRQEIERLARESTLPSTTTGWMSRTD